VSSKNKINIFLVDDDAVYLKSMEIEFLEQCDFMVHTFNSGEKCIEHLNIKPDVIILDYHLDGINKGAINGIETLDRIKSHDRNIPVVILSSQDKIEVAVRCMQHMAFDYVVKSETAFVRLQQIITTIFRYKIMEKELNWYIDRT
jgi:two-component system OmpR family response regulator